MTQRYLIKYGILGIAIVLGAYIVRPVSNNKGLEKYLLEENKSLTRGIIQANKEINQLKLNIVKSHEKERKILSDLPNATISELDSTWARFFEMLHD
jgi:hypothetical protein